MSEAPIKQMQELLQKSLIKIKTLEAELETVKNSKTISPNEDIAIVGYAFRFPNQINTLQKFWELLIQNKETVTKIPATRFDVDEIFSEDPYAAGKTNTKYGSFLTEDVSFFDASFFGIPPREAKSIDPIQRILLEIVYEAFENAGIPSNEMKGKNVGVYVAVGVSDYIQARLRSGQLEDIDVYDTTGIPFATICGRISYTYDFNGESISVDTACSSAMVALHHASSALQQQEIDMAVVASANLLLTPELFVGLTKLGSNSPSGKTKAFADDADGYVRAEGAAVLLLKRKADALKNNDTISLLVKGSFVKHNGTSNGFTAPNPQVQSSTIIKALENAKLNVDDIDFVESHGIGNKITDAMEI
ncbi:MAG TPA: polyketide synthase, partial [Chitinophagales bacterium]|nr:polyketide synthase [Chitinophagales bacterium]